MAQQGKAAAAPPAAARSAGVPLKPWSEFYGRDLPGVTDPSKLKTALEMLRADRFQLFEEVGPDRVVGVVRGQWSATRIFACRLAEDGGHACCTQILRTCILSRGSPCKHLLVLVLGLVNARQLEPEAALEWLGRSRGQAGVPDKDETTAIFLRYKGAEAGTVDWRPTETIPEDFYAM